VPSAHAELVADVNMFRPLVNERYRDVTPPDPGKDEAQRRLRRLSRSSTSSRRALYGITLLWPTCLLSLPT